MVHKYIKRDWTDHTSSNEYLSDEDEYIKFEVFSFDPSFTQTYTAKDNTLRAENAKKVNFKSIPCFQSKDKINVMEFTLDYKTEENGLYRIDILYEQSNKMYTGNDAVYNTGKDLAGWYDIYLAGSKAEHKAVSQIPVGKLDPSITGDLKIDKQTYKLLTQISKKSTGITDLKKKADVPVSSKPLTFEGENNALKRKTLFQNWNAGTYKVEFAVPYNCYVIGAIIRKVVKFWGTNNDEPGSNLQFTEATLNDSEILKAKELEVTVGFDDSFECPDNRSGLYLEYMDEANLYVKNLEGNVVRKFGGYVSTPLPTADKRTISIHCADRLKDGENRYILDLLLIQDGAEEHTDYDKNTTKSFKEYGQALKYLCKMYEQTLKSNIGANSHVQGEKWKEGFTLTFGKKKKIKKISVTNGKTKVNKKSIMLRNNASGKKKQVWQLYKAKNPQNITPYNNLHLTIGLGDTKTEHKQKSTIASDGSNSANAQKWGKCGRSADGKYIMGIGQKSSAKDPKSYKYSDYYKGIFKNKCPHCGGKLVWDSGRSDSNCVHCGGYKHSKKEWGSIPETEFTCEGCCADYSIFGNEKDSPWKKLEKVSITKSSKSEQNKLHKGEMVAVADKNQKISSDDIFKAIKKASKGWRHDTGTGSTASYLEKHGVGDCWAWSDWISKQLKKYKVNHKISEYKSSGSNVHRSVLYQNSKGKYVDFPYRDYNFPNGTYNTSGSKNGKKVYTYKAGGRINQAVVSGKGSGTQTIEKTITNGYDKDAPFQAYIDLCFYLGASKKKHHLYIDFTQSSKSDYSITGLKPVWANNHSKKISLVGICDKIREYWHTNQDIYVDSISFIAPKIVAKTKDDKTTWYTNDKNTEDNSSCKMLLYELSINNQPAVEPSDLQANGKSVNDVMKGIVESGGYTATMVYGEHRKDDEIHFRVDEQGTPVFTATEGDDNNILEWGSINYNPANELFNNSTCVFKRKKTTKYSYVETTDIDSIIKFQEQTTLITENEGIGEQEAYYNARHNEKFNPDQTYTYTITVKGSPDLDINDLVEVIADMQILNTLKEVKSTTLKYAHNSKPVLQTDIGLDELAPDLQLRKTIKEMRDTTKQKSTYFGDGKGGADAVNNDELYEWEY